jgi:hypothetical protein
MTCIGMCWCSHIHTDANKDPFARGYNGPHLLKVIHTGVTITPAEFFDIIKREIIRAKSIAREVENRVSIYLLICLFANLIFITQNNKRYMLVRDTYGSK